MRSGLQNGQSVLFQCNDPLREHQLTGSWGMLTREQYHNTDGLRVSIVDDSLESISKSVASLEENANQKTLSRKGVTRAVLEIVKQEAAKPPAISQRRAVFQIVNSNFCGQRKSREKYKMRISRGNCLKNGKPRTSSRLANEGSFLSSYTILFRILNNPARTYCSKTTC